MQRFALLLGSNGNGSNNIFAENDVRRIEKWLIESHSGWFSSNVQVVIPSNFQNRGDLELDLQRSLQRCFLEDTSEEDFIFFYYAGHARVRKNQLFLDLERISLSCWNLLDNYVAKSQARNIFMVFDCCSSGNVVDMFQHSLQKGWLPQIIGKNQVGIRPDQQRAILAACRADQLAYEQKNEYGVGGAFTYHFMRGCDGKGKYGRKKDLSDDDGIVRVSSLEPFLIQELGGQQTPRIFLQGNIAICTSFKQRVAKQNARAKVTDILMFPDEREISMNGYSPDWVISGKEGIYAFDSTKDRRLIAVGYLDGKVALFRKDGTSVLGIEDKPLGESAPSALGLAITYDGEEIVIQSDKARGGIRIYNAKSGEQYNVAFNDNAGVTNPFAVTPETKYIITSDKSGVIQVWYMNGEPSASGQGHTGRLTSILALLNDGKQIISAGEDGKVNIWDLGVLDGKQEQQTLIPKTLARQVAGRKVTSLATTNDGRFVAAGYGSGHIDIWDTQDFASLPRGLPNLHSEYVKALAFSSNGEWLATGGSDGLAYLIHLPAKDPMFQQIVSKDESSSPISSVTFFPSKNRTLLVVGTTLGSVYLYQPGIGNRVEVPKGERKGVFMVKVVGETEPSLFIISTSTIESWKLPNGYAIEK